MMQVKLAVYMPVFSGRPSAPSFRRAPDAQLSVMKQGTSKVPSTLLAMSTFGSGVTEVTVNAGASEPAGTSRSARLVSPSSANALSRMASARSELFSSEATVKSQER